MIRYFDVAVVAATILVAIALYAFKYDTGHLAQEIARLEAAIAAEEAAVNVLRAEWSLLNQPERLQALADRHLELELLRAEQIQTYTAIPQRPPREALTELVRRSLGSGVEFGEPGRGGR